MHSNSLCIPLRLYLNVKIKVVTVIMYSLYIPLWLYANFAEAFYNEMQRNFTFHSGYILMIDWCESTWNPVTFTFHSGYILIVPRPFELSSTPYFTFHSGYILIEKLYGKQFNMFGFTFHSGYILILSMTALSTSSQSLHSMLVIS